MASGIDGAARLRKMEKEFLQETMHMSEALRILVHTESQSEAKERVTAAHRNLINFPQEKLAELAALPEVSAAVICIRSRWIDGYHNWLDRLEAAIEAAFSAIETVIEKGTPCE